MLFATHKLAAASAPALEAPADPPTATEPAIAARMVEGTKVYGSGDTAVRALDGVSLGFAAGRLTAIMGPSGCGKSTLLHCLTGLDTLTTGRVYIAETDLGALNDQALTRVRRDAIGFVFQAYNLVPTLTVAENIQLPAMLAGRKPDAKWFDRVVRTVRLHDRLSHRPHELSGGQQQRVAVARALVNRPTLILADEPTGNLDSRSGAEILRFMRLAVDQMDQTIVVVTHDPSAAAYADRVVFLADGRVVDELAAPTAGQVIDRMKQFGN